MLQRPPAGFRQDLLLLVIAGVDGAGGEVVVRLAQGLHLVRLERVAIALALVLTPSFLEVGKGGKVSRSGRAVSRFQVVRSHCGCRATRACAGACTWSQRGPHEGVGVALFQRKTLIPQAHAQLLQLLGHGVERRHEKTASGSGLWTQGRLSTASCKPQILKYKLPFSYVKLAL